MSGGAPLIQRKESPPCDGRRVMELTVRLEKAHEGHYPVLPFEVPPGIKRVTVAYRYPRHTRERQVGLVTSRETAAIDLALCAPGGAYLGSSGSNRAQISVSATGSSAGFAAHPACAGTWQIICGAYHVPDEGLEVAYTVTLEEKKRALLRGDTHLHTEASDGAATLADTVALAEDLGLDYIFTTDHNTYAQNLAPPHADGLTLMPGCEWTHFKGHAGLLGVKRPFAGSFVTEDLDATRALLQSARDAGALAVLNHPFCPLVPWRWGFEVPFDAVEVWNGVWSERNARAVGFWHQQLCAGARLPALGGSDYHSPGLLGSLAMPCHCLWAPSRDPEDILAALRAGSGFISYLPSGPVLDMDCGGASFGQAAPAGAPVELRFTALEGGDALSLITDLGEEKLQAPAGAVELVLTRQFPGARFVRAEVDRVYAPGLPPMKALVGNPLYFE